MVFSSRPRGPRPSPLFRATRRGFGAEGAVVFASGWGIEDSLKRHSITKD